jgi:hypothetical protein
MSKKSSTLTSMALSKTDLIRALNDGLFKISLGYNENDDPIMVADVKSNKYGVEVQCTDGSSFSLKLEMN